MWAAFCSGGFQGKLFIMIHALPFRMTGSMADAEDVAQESFIQAFRQLDGYRAEDFPQGLNMRGSAPPPFIIIFCSLPIFFIICCIWPNLFSIVFRSETRTPLPLAMRMRRLALRICGWRRSCAVIEQIIASMCMNSLSDLLISAPFII